MHYAIDWFQGPDGLWLYREPHLHYAHAVVYPRGNGTWHWDAGAAGGGDAPSLARARAAAELAFHDGPPAAPEDEEPFSLRNDPQSLRPRRFANQGHTLQKALIDGLDCLPGQQDLF